MHKILRAKSQEPGASPDLSRPARAPALSTSAACLLSRQPLLVLLAAFLLLTSGNAYAQDSVESDRAALVAFYNATAGANWTEQHELVEQRGRSRNGTGSTTDEDGRVTESEYRRRGRRQPADGRDPGGTGAGGFDPLGLNQSAEGPGGVGKSSPAGVFARTTS